MGCFMKWRGRQGSSNIEDRRSFGSGGGGGIRITPKSGGGISLIILLLIVLINRFSNFNILDSQVLENNSYVSTHSEDEKIDFLSVVLKDTEDVWHSIFNAYNLQYSQPKLIIFNGAINSGCGFAGQQMGPFYCPRDKKVYMDLSFFDKLAYELGASGDFAISYVLAHEVGHHVQNLLGILDEKHQLMARLSEKDANEISVKIELQADYLAGVFAKHVESLGYLDEDDIEEAINAASAVGDDILQKRYQGTVVPDSFTHGSADMRVRWFLKGYNAGDLSDFDTFKYDIDEL